MGHERIIEGPHGDVFDLHISETAFLHAVKLRIDFSAATHTMHNRRGHGFQSDLIRKLLAEHGLRGAGVDGEFVRSLTVDHHAAKDEIQGFAESNGSRILRRRHHSDVRAERFQHLETGFGFGKPVRIARIQPDILFKLLPLFRVVFSNAHASLPYSRYSGSFGSSWMARVISCTACFALSLAIASLPRPKWARATLASIRKASVYSELALSKFPFLYSISPRWATDSAVLGSRSRRTSACSNSSRDRRSVTVSDLRAWREPPGSTKNEVKAMITSGLLDMV